ncbi:MAG: mechanosensitive ion channel [Bacteroidetes bacterium]|nr:mechanosensitive ion channel [Bacteroidota bacterium]
MSFDEILEHELINVGDYKLYLSQVLSAILILVLARLFIWLMGRFFFRRFYRKRQVEVGRQFAVKQIFKYFVYTAAVLFALQTLGVTLSAVWAGTAALLVGIGLGLQQTFTDLMSGIILLFEGSVRVGDVVIVDDIVGKVKKIGLRTATVETRDEFDMLVPNSRLVTNNVTNWSHNASPTRFQVKVGVAYSSDVELVTRLLLKAAKKHPEVLKKPVPRIEFEDFGNSSLNFTLHFYSWEFLKIEFVKSDLRYQIQSLFQQNQVEIPFPQRDVWIRRKGE